jgi:hypothetical protein
MNSCVGDLEYKDDKKFILLGGSPIHAGVCDDGYMCEGLYKPLQVSW